MNKPVFVFREAQSIQELKNLFRLRYKVYRESRLRGFVRKNEHRVDMDCYELHSRHFGLFMVQGSNIQAVGFHRPVQEAEGPHKEWIMQIADEFDMTAEVLKTPKDPLPIMSYWPDKEVVQWEYKKIKSRGQSLVEATKFGIVKSVSSFALAKHIAESEIAIQFFCFGFNHAIMSCTPIHARFYRNYGFHKMANTNNCKIYDVPASCLLASANRLPNQLKEKSLEMARVFIKTGQICYDPNRPNQIDQVSAPQNAPITKRYALAA